jgi:D-alanine-D-alanine ligase
MKTVLLLFGGESTEHEVSVASATNVDQAIDKNKFTVIYSYIDRNGVWWRVDGIVTDLESGTKQLLPQFGRGTFLLEGTEITITPDVILAILHGKNGEDGTVQAVAQLLHIPIVGCDMTASAAAMNKYITKQVAMANNIRVSPFTIHYTTDSTPVYDEVAKKLSATLFVKPANAGSSVGVYKVTNQEELDKAITGAHMFDDIVLIEQAIDARELEIAVLGNYPAIEASVVGEIKAEGAFYSYESKYDESSQSSVVIPAEISPELSDELRRQAILIFHLLGCSGMARVDFFIDRNTHDIYLNEVNTIPGFTDISMYPKTWEYGGVSYAQLIERLITLALTK